jgi:hypothetical protein
MLTFLQLSDIHFRGESGERKEEDEEALDYEFRELLITDARSVLEDLGGASGVLVCGDIADSGEGSQFTQASDWLQNLCNAVGVDPWLVWVVPGNHDLDQTKIGTDQERLRERMRAASPIDSDATLQGIINHPGDREALLAPLFNYLEFAAAYACGFGTNMYWSEEIDLGSHQVCLRGLNSALICGPGSDKESDRKLVIGTRQASFASQADLLHYTLCHHPYQWLMDLPAVEQCFIDDVHFRVTGHRHVRWLDRTPLGLYLGAGAVSPNRGENGEFTAPCIPRYEVISIGVVDIGGVPHLDLIVRGRIWQEGGWVEDLGPGGFAARRYEIGKPNSGRDIPPPDGSRALEIFRPERELHFRLARFQAYDREQCAAKIGAPLDEVVQAPPHRQVDILYEWATANDKLADLWTAMTEAAQLKPSSTNPFA